MQKVCSIIFTFVFILVLSSRCLFAFENGPVLNIIGEFGGSSTVPVISDDDLKKLGANKMEGMTGMVPAVVVESGYIFGAKQYMGFKDDSGFSGAGVFGYIGVAEGYAGQVSGTEYEGQQINVYFNIYYSPVILAGVTGKAYFLKNRLALGLSLGVKVIADTQPTYEMYSSHSDTIASTVGTIVVEEWMMTKMNAVSFNFKTSIEYNIPLLDTLEIILGAYFGGNIYSPKYITMPPDLLEMAIGNSGFDPQEPIESYYINSIEYGIKAGIGLRL